MFQATGQCRVFHEFVKKTGVRFQKCFIIPIHIHQDGHFLERTDALRSPFAVHLAVFPAFAQQCGCGEAKAAEGLEICGAMNPSIPMALSAQQPDMFRNLGILISMGYPIDIRYYRYYRYTPTFLF